MEVAVIVDKNITNISININYYKGKYIIELLFPSKEAYLAFLNKGVIKKEYFIEIASNGLDYLKNNLKTFKELLDSTKITYVIRHISDLVDITGKDEFILDISNLSWNDKLLIIYKLASSNTCFLDDYSLDEVLSLDEIKCIYEIINNIAASLIDKSPLEQIYSVYNLLKQRPYIKGCEDNGYESRSLNQILYNPEIVCLGYVNYSKAITDALGLKSTKVYWRDFDGGHSTSMYFINDPKYNVSGIYALDITADAEKYNSIKHFLYPMDIAIKEMEHFGFSYNHTDNIYFSLLGSFQRLQTFRKYFSESNEIIIREKELLS